MELTRAAVDGTPVGRRALREHEAPVSDACLVLGEEGDQSALWLVAKLRAAGEPCVLATPQLLSFARRRSQRLGVDGVEASVAFVADTVVEAPRLVINRMLRAPSDAWHHTAAAERDYAIAELAAFVLSWLAGLPGTVRNRPTPASLAGPSPDPLLAAFAASRVGFDCPTVRWDDGSSPYPLLEAALRAGGATGRVVQLVVLDGAVVGVRRIEALLGQRIPARTLDAAARFAAAIDAQQALIGLDVVVDDADRWWFGGMTPLPDLEAGGDELVAALRGLAPAGATR